MTDKVHIRFDPDGDGPICYAVDPDRHAEDIDRARRFCRDVHDEADCPHQGTPLPDDPDEPIFGARPAAAWLTGGAR